MSQQFDVLVIGGGIVGLSAALAMNQRDFSVGLIDLGPMVVDSCNIDSRVYAINNASQTLLHHLGAWKLIDSSRISPYQHMHVWDAASSAHIDFDARLIGTDRLGSIIEECIIKQALLQQISNTPIATFPHCRITHLQKSSDGITIQAGKKNWRTKLLIIADGANSFTRSLLNVSTISWPYHQHAIVTTIHVKKPHDSTAYQVFNKDGPLAFLPLANNHQCSIVWSTTPRKSNQLMTLTDDEFAQQITQAFANKLGDCNVIGPRHQFPLHMRHTKHYSGPHWLLMGDAAHTIHPLAGLGLNVGLDDLRSWIANLPPNKEQAWCNKTLAIYQRERKYKVWKMIALMEGLKSIFANPIAPLITLRSLGIKTCHRLTPLKRFLIEQVTGIYDA